MSHSNNQIILGIHDGHNASACLVRNGQILAALAEERLTNVKNQSGVPIQAIKKIFETTKIDPEDVDAVALSSLNRMGNPLKPSNLPMRIMETLPFALPYTHISRWFRQTDDVHKVLKELGVNASIKPVEHHLAHAASAYFQRPWREKTLILTLDGAGDGLSATVNIGSGDQITRVKSTSYYDSLSNNLYSEVTGFMGMKRWEHEYKLMGLAPYGKPEYLLKSLSYLISLDPQNGLKFKNHSGRYARGMQSILRTIFREQRFDNIAAATQKYFEELVLAWVKNAIKHTGVHKLACGGGSFLNVRANQLIRELPQVKDVFFDPVCDDAGTSVGAALYLAGTGVPLETLYLGVEYSGLEINSAIKKYRLTKWISRPRNLAQKIAKLLSEGKIVARFAGRDEFGPRALGNRSIMADPRSPEAIRKINFAIKMRDFWMPFAPVILEEDMDKYLIAARQAPYMIESFHTKPKAHDIIAGLHPFDLTCRPQTINAKQNPDYYQIVNEFKKITGVGGLLNTSFNLHGFPIVGTPERAIYTFLNSGLDYLVINDILLSKPN